MRVLALLSILTVAMLTTALTSADDPNVKPILPAGHTREIISVALSADGKHMATGSYDTTAILWEAATGKPLQTFDGHNKHLVYSVALSADGKHVVTGSHDQTAILWEVATGKKLRTRRAAR
jgi:WD40 repeat protein